MNKQVVFTVEGMSCGGCASKIKKLFSEEFSGIQAEVDLEAKRVSLPTSFDGSPLDAKKSDRSFWFSSHKNAKCECIISG